MSRVLKSSQIVIDSTKYKLDSVNPLIVDKVTPLNNNAEDEINKKYAEAEKMIEKKLSEAKKESESIISNAYEKAKLIIEEAKNDGFKEGLDKGFQQGKKQADEIISEALALKKDIIKTKEKLIKNIEKDTIDLVIKTIEKILNKRIEEDYELIESLIKLGLEKCNFTQTLTLRVSPNDYDFAIQIKDRIALLIENISDIIIKEDKSLQKGSCVIDTSSGSVDSSIWTQFNQIKESFEEILKSE